MREGPHTMGQFGVSEEKENALREKMTQLGIREEDLLEKFVRSGGHGGQNVNKTATCVYLRHLPTGIEVKCQRERSQALNRFFARRILVEKIEAMLLGKKSEHELKIERIRRQKLKRAKRAKAKLNKTDTSDETVRAEKAQAPPDEPEP